MTPERYRQPGQLYHEALEQEPDERTAALTGDTAKSRKSYEDFFSVWKDADPGMPNLREASQEYNNLR